MNIVDCYQVLGLRSGASLSEIKASYRRLVRRYHPDVNLGDQQAQDRFIQVTQAYKFLLSVVKAVEATEPSQSQAASSEGQGIKTTGHRSSAKITRKSTSASCNTNLSEAERRLKHHSDQELRPLLRHQRFPRAIALVESLAQRLPQDPEVREWQAATYQRYAHYLIERKQPDKARIYLKKALRIDPHNRSLWTEVERNFRQIEHLH